MKDLRAQLSEERAQLKAVSAEKEVLAKDNYDLRRQVSYKIFRVNQFDL